MIQNKILKDINKLSDEEKILVSQNRLEKAQKEKMSLKSSLEAIEDIISYLEKKIISLQNKNDDDLAQQNLSNDTRIRIRRSSHDRVKVNLYLAESLRSKLDALNTTKKPLAQWIRGRLDNYFSDLEYKKSIDQYLSDYEDYERSLFENKALRKTFVVGIDKNIFVLTESLSKQHSRDCRFIIESILLYLQ